MSPGDLVVCVTLMKPCSCAREMGHPGIPPGLIPIVGRHYRVNSVGTGLCWGCGEAHPALSVIGVELGNHSWPQSCFRRLEPASEDIFRLADAPLELEPA